MFQLGFTATTATIISGALSERISFISYAIISIFVTLLIYPVFGHWAWGGTWLSGAENQGWLAKIGFRDFAGSSVVHSVGGWVALIGAIMVGPRLERFATLRVTQFAEKHGYYDIAGEVQVTEERVSFIVRKCYNIVAQVKSFVMWG